ncbi:MAG: DoxX family membrane protein [Candidatus Promineifilaceae bacterium]
MIVQRFSRSTFTALFVATVALWLLPNSAEAHVKWFANFNFSDPPLTLAQVVTPLFIGLAALSVVVICAMVVIDNRLTHISWYNQINQWLADRKTHSLTVMRVAIAATLLISWANNTLLTPELALATAWVSWLQFAIAILLLFPRTTSYAGTGVLLLYGLAVLEFGTFHMLDYLHFVGIGLYLATAQLENKRWRDIGLPALFATIGFSLIWLGYEKLVYPSWTLYLLEQNPQLAMGLPPSFFLYSAAFVEMSLGFLLIIGLLERPLAAIITLVFFSTTLIFGKLEVIGHTPLHAALVVFLLSGSDTFYPAPIQIHKKMNWRVAFAGVNFILALALFGLGYTVSAQQQFARASSTAVVLEPFDLTNSAEIPTFTTLEAIPDMGNGYNLHAAIDNWAFTPAALGTPSIPNEGHAHVYLNGEKVTRMYGDWISLGALAPGTYQVVVTLNGNDHREFVVDGRVISAETTFVVRP